MSDMFSNVMLLVPLAFLKSFVGAWRLYIFARRPTNSRGGTDPVSLLNFPSHGGCLHYTVEARDRNYSCRRDPDCPSCRHTDRQS